jgi:hypothetical protein
MKHLLIILLFLPIAGFAQKQADYEQAMSRFVKFYNNNQGDSIKNMWPPKERGDWMDKMWSKERIESNQKEYGKILSYKYIGIDTEDPNPGLAVFKTQFSVVGWKTTSMTLEKGHYLSTFRFITSSDGIKKLLEQQK